MFNRVAQQETATSHNITDIMSKSRKRTPVSTWCCCKSQKQGKQFCHRMFRRQERVMIHKNQFERLPCRQWEIVSQWDLGGDGKCYYRGDPTEEWFVKLMRKWEWKGSDSNLNVGILVYFSKWPPFFTFFSWQFPKSEIQGGESSNPVMCWS